MTTDNSQLLRQEVLSRIELAHQLLARVERLSALLGTVLATEVQLLKRDLSHGREVLRAAGESSFLSVVTLVESTLACLFWKQYTHEVVDALGEAFMAGTRQGAFHLHPVRCNPPTFRRTRHPHRPDHRS